MSSGADAAEEYYIGVDVGTGSARATIVAKDGTIAASSTQETRTWRDPQDHRVFEQSTDDIWARIAAAVRAVLRDAGVRPAAVRGLGFDATCSLAVADAHGDPVVVTKGAQLGEVGARNVVLWADHRAEAEAELINSTGSVVLDYVGGVMSLEMEVPKILWLKNHMPPAHFARCQFFDLPDFLTYRATGASTRSCCSLTCKCSFVPTKGGWQPEFFARIGLPDLPAGGFAQLGAQGGPREALTAGLPVGRGLSRQAAEELGLLEGTPVGSGLIDAYAGWVGTIAARHYEADGTLSPAITNLDESRHRLAAVAGTSTCHVVQSPEGVFVPGVWGPYKDAVFPGWWMNEGGQSSTGQLIDFMITTHPAHARLTERAAAEGKTIHDVLEDVLEQLRVEEGAATLTALMKDVHFYPDLHGNRSPIADPRMRGAIVGLALDDTLGDLARKYYLTLEAIALQTRHILDALNARGHAVRAVYVSGGQARNARLMRLVARACRAPVVLPHASGAAVVLGAAMLGRFAADVRAGRVPEGARADALWRIMVEMTPPGTLVPPDVDAQEEKLLEAKYKIFREQIDIQQRWRKEMDEAAK